jgi:hypothetical protein
MVTAVKTSINSYIFIIFLNNEECRLQGCYPVWLFSQPTLRRNLAPPSSRWQSAN